MRNLKTLARDCQIKDQGRAAERDGPADGRGDGRAAGLLSAGIGPVLGYWYGGPY